jgi:hypothetical protein
MSRTRRLRPLPEDLPATTRTLLQELRTLKDRSGYDLRALEGKTYASRSSWGRWLSGESWIPCEAVETMAELCGGDKQRLRNLWHRADDDRRSPLAAEPAEDPVPTPGEQPDSRDAGTQDDGVASGGAPADGGHAPFGGARADGGLAASGGAPADGGPAAAGDGETELDVAAPQRREVPGRRRMRAVGATLGCSLAAGAIGLATGMSLRPETAKAPRPQATPTYVQWITRPQIIARALTWRPHSDQRVPYDQAKNHDGYRTDGSGYASMALGLPAPGPNSTDLAWGGYTRQIRPAQLLPGDLIINATGPGNTRQVAIFERWANTAHTAYWVYQQRRGYGTDRLVLRNSMAANGPYHPYRPMNINEQPGIGPSS